MTAELTPLPPGEVSLLAARGAPDLAAAGYVEAEYAVRGTATAHAGETADFATRVVVRRPEDPARASGTLLAEWLNVSSGQDSAPDWAYLEAEILRRGHTWVGVSAQYVGIEGGRGSGVMGDNPLPSLRTVDPGSASSTSSMAEKWDRFGAGSPVACTAASRPAFQRGRSGSSCGFSPNIPSLASSRSAGTAMPGRAS